MAGETYMLGSRPSKRFYVVWSDESGTYRREFTTEKERFAFLVNCDESEADYFLLTVLQPEGLIAFDKAPLGRDAKFAMG